MKLEFAYVDTCLSSYWSGHHLPHVQIPVWRGMTMRQIKEALRWELRDGAVMGSNDDARLLSYDLYSDEKRASQLTKKAYAAINRLKPSVKGQRKFFMDLEERPDDYFGEEVYAFFVILEV